MASRGVVESGEFTYEVVHFLKDGDEFEWKKKGTFAFDERSQRTIHWFSQTFGKSASDPNPWGATPGDGVAEQTDDGIRYRGGALFAVESSIAYSPRSRGGTAILGDAVSTGPLFVPFDYRAFGFAFYGDLIQNKSFDRVLPNYLAVKDKDVPEVGIGDLPTSMRLPNETANPDARHFNFGGCILRIDTERDYWVTDARFANPQYKVVDGATKKVGETLESECNVLLQQVDGYWVPKRATYKSKSRRLVYTLGWKSVNPPMGKIDFSPERLGKQVNKPLVRFR